MTDPVSPRPAASRTSASRGPDAREQQTRQPTPEERIAVARSVRDEWLHHGLSTQPADRAAAEAAVVELYRCVGAAPPRFAWFPSPAAAVAAIAETTAPTPTTASALTPPTAPDAAAAAGAKAHGGFGPVSLSASATAGRTPNWLGWPVWARLATLVSELRERLDRRIGRAAPNWPSPWDPPPFHRTRPVEQSLHAGLGIDVVIGALVHDSLRASLHDAIRAPLRTAVCGPQHGDAPGLTWYGQHDAYWIAHYLAHARTGLAEYGPRDTRQLGLWAALARSTGWWWASSQLCVMAERPVEVHTQPLPNGRHGELRLHRADAPALRFADGTGLYALHGTPVPEWVVTDPSVERIHREANIEVRRCAVERIGWDAYIDRAGLTRVASAADPGNPGCALHLYDAPAGVWGRPVRILLAVNGSPEADGRHRRYGLTVPAYIDDAVWAAGWTYGLSGAQYAQLARRT